MTPGCSVCGYEVEVVRSCFRSRWRLFAGRPETTAGRYISAPDDAPAYPGWHNLWSRDWTSDEPDEGELGEDRAAVRQWASGAPIGPVPPPGLVGSAECIADGERWPLTVVPDLVGGFDVRCPERIAAPGELLHVLAPGNWCYWMRAAARVYSDPNGLWAQLAADYATGQTGIVYQLPESLFPNFVLLTQPAPAPWVIVIAGTDRTAQWIEQIVYGALGPQAADRFSTNAFWWSCASLVLDRMLLFDPSPTQPIVLVGHSLGGAVASVLAARLRLESVGRRIQVLTFGCPRPGDSRLSQLLLTCEHAAIETRGDAIVGLPLRSDEIPIIVDPLRPVFGPRFGGPWQAPPNRFVVGADRVITPGADNPGFAEASIAFILWALAGRPFPNLSIHIPSTYLTRLCGDIVPEEALLWGNTGLVFTAHAELSEGESAMTTGAIVPFAGALVPTGHLACDGTDYAEGDWPELFGAIGHVWDTFRGQGSPGAGRFRVPWLDGLSLVGAGAAGTTPTTSARALADQGGEEEHTLTKPELAIHNHGLNDPGHFHTPASGGFFRTLVAGTAALLNGGNTLTKLYDPTTSTNATGITVQDEGADTPHNNMIPFAAIQWVIKT